MKCLILAVLLLSGCSKAAPPPQCDVTFGQDDATARAWADANQAAKEARHAR